MTVDLKKLRLTSKDSGIGQSTQMSNPSDPPSSPEWDEFPFTDSAGAGGGTIHGFCCATFPLTKGLTKTLKRL